MSTLSARESEIAEYTAWGASAKEIGDVLHISTVTVQNHIKHVKEKLKLQKATEISAWWFCNRFHISMELSPMRRAFGCIVLVALVSVECFNFSGSDFRARRFRSARRARTEQYES